MDRLWQSFHPREGESLFKEKVTRESDIFQPPTAASGEGGLQERKQNVSLFPVADLQRCTVLVMCESSGCRTADLQSPCLVRIRGWDPLTNS
jgi:hypothetical protein